MWLGDPHGRGLKQYNRDTDRVTVWLGCAVVTQRWGLSSTVVHKAFADRNRSVNLMQQWRRKWNNRLYIAQTTAALQYYKSRDRNDDIPMPLCQHSWTVTGIGLFISDIGLEDKIIWKWREKFEIQSQKVVERPYIECRFWLLFNILP